MTFYEFVSEFFRKTMNIKGTYLKAPHIIVALLVTALWIFLASYFGMKNRNLDEEKKIIPMKICAFIMLGVAVVNAIHVFMISETAQYYFQHEMPFFLCDILKFAIPIYALFKGKLPKACGEYIICLGFLAAMMGVWFNANVFENHPIWSFRVINNISLHAVPGFCALYLIVSKSSDLSFKRIHFTYSILAPFIIMALILDFSALEGNYMFLRDPQGTPFKLFFSLVNGNLAGYAILVIVGMCSYICAFYGGWLGVTKIIEKVKKPKATLN